MISCKLEQIGDRFALVLDADDVARLSLRVGETVHLEEDATAHLHIVERESFAEDVHARGRAFLRRYHRSFDRLS
jgi:hypothetical protein